MAIQNLKTIDERRSKLVRTKFSIAIYRPTGDKWQSKTMFPAIFGPCSSIVKSIFDCLLRRKGKEGFPMFALNLQTPNLVNTRKESAQAQVYVLSRK